MFAINPPVSYWLHCRNNALSNHCLSSVRSRHLP
nr:MAG TPA: hypothetical protein [Bacteriophage sp.]